MSWPSRVVPSRRGGVGLAILVLLALVAGACGHGSVEATRGSSAAPSRSAAVVAELDFTAPAVGGGSIHGSDYGGKDVVLWFWAPWCEVCNAEAPEVAQLTQRNGDIRFLGIPGRDSEEPMREFVSRYGLTFPQAIDTDGSLWARFGVPAQPAWTFIDGQTGEATTMLGPVPASDIEARLDALRANDPE